MIMMIMRVGIKMGMQSLQDEIQNKYKSKKLYENKHKYVPIEDRFGLKKEDVVLIEKKVDMLYTEISKKYSVTESEVYDKLYLKVRKLFVEMM